MLAIINRANSDRQCKTTTHIHTFDSTSWAIIPHRINWGEAGKDEKGQRSAPVEWKEKVTDIS